MRSSNYENELQTVEHSSSVEHGFKKGRKWSGRTSKRFQKSRIYDEEEEMLENAVSLSTRYKNKQWINVFEEWIRDRENKRAVVEEKSLGISLNDINGLDIKRWEKMTPLSLNFWIGKFVEEVANKNGLRYPARTLYQVVFGLKRYLEGKNRNDVNMLDKSNMW